MVCELQLVSRCSVGISGFFASFHLSMFFFLSPLESFRSGATWRYPVSDVGTSLLPLFSRAAMEARLREKYGEAWMERNCIERVCVSWYTMSCRACQETRGWEGCSRRFLLWEGDIEQHLDSKKHRNAVSWYEPPRACREDDKKEDEMGFYRRPAERPVSSSVSSHCGSGFPSRRASFPSQSRDPACFQSSLNSSDEDEVKMNEYGRLSNAGLQRIIYRDLVSDGDDELTVEELAKKMRRKASVLEAREKPTANEIRSDVFGHWPVLD